MKNYGIQSPLLGSGEMHFLPHGSYLSVGETDTNYYDQLWNHKIDTCSWEVKSSRNKEDSVGLAEEETDTKMCKELTSERRKALRPKHLCARKNHGGRGNRAPGGQTRGCSYRCRQRPSLCEDCGLYPKTMVRQEATEATTYLSQSMCAPKRSSPLRQ